MENQTYIYLGIAALLLAVFLALVILVRRRRKTAEQTPGTSLSEKLSRTRSGFISRLSGLLGSRNRLDEELYYELEEVLLEADIGLETTEWILQELRSRARDGSLDDPGRIRTELEQVIREMLRRDYKTEKGLDLPDTGPVVILFTGVNGVGKTTTIGKLAHRFREKGNKVLLIAADTFRAAAGEQLAVWAERTGSLIHRQKPGSDPSSVVFDGISLALNRKLDYILIDTAGRQHTKINLMNELEKINRTIKKLVPEAPHETILVLDATTGQNALAQTEKFNRSTGLTGIALCKLDGSAKGGIIIGIKHQFNIPVKLIGIGETVNDLKDFSADEFVTALFGEK